MFRKVVMIISFLTLLLAGCSGGMDSGVTSGSGSSGGGDTPLTTTGDIRGIVADFASLDATFAVTCNLDGWHVVSVGDDGSFEFLDIADEVYALGIYDSGGDLVGAYGYTVSLSPTVSALSIAIPMEDASLESGIDLGILSYAANGIGDGIGKFEASTDLSAVLASSVYQSMVAYSSSIFSCLDNGGEGNPDESDDSRRTLTISLEYYVGCNNWERVGDYCMDETTFGDNYFVILQTHDMDPSLPDEDAHLLLPTGVSYLDSLFDGDDGEEIYFGGNINYKISGTPPSGTWSVSLDNYVAVDPEESSPWEFYRNLPDVDHVIRLGVNLYETEAEPSKAAEAKNCVGYNWAWFEYDYNVSAYVQMEDTTENLALVNSLFNIDGTFVGFDFEIGDSPAPYYPSRMDIGYGDAISGTQLFDAATTDSNIEFIRTYVESSDSNYAFIYERYQDPEYLVAE